MFKLMATGSAVLAFALAAQPGAAAAAIGPDAAACRSGDGPALIVNVSGFKARSGRVRINVYGADASRFLERGKYVRQIDIPVTRTGTMPVCVDLPRAGNYAVAVRHDIDGDGSDWGDGGGFSRNPRLSLTSLRPRYQNVAFAVGAGVQKVDIVLNYRFGLSVRPVRA